MSSMWWSWRPGTDAMVVTALRPDHAPALSDIHCESFAHGWDEASIAAMLVDRMVEGDGLFAASGAAPAPTGFVLSRCVLDEAEILTIAIGRRLRGRRLSGQLLQRHLANLAGRGVRVVHLEVEEGNAPAIRLYQRFGFVRTGERKGYYLKADGQRATALLMTLDLAPYTDARNAG